MKRSKHINNVVGIILVTVLMIILIHDIQPPVIDTLGIDKSVPMSTESPNSDHTDGCDAACPCVIHLLEESLGFSWFQIDNLSATSSIRITMCLTPESIILKSIYRPPEA